MKTHAIGQVLFWYGGSLWIGRNTGATDMHSHHAIQITLALEGTFQLKMTDDNDWSTFRSAIVRPHEPHALRSTDSILGTIFVEPELHEGQVLLDAYCSERARSLPDQAESRCVSALHEAYRDTYQSSKLVEAAQEVIRYLAADGRAASTIDPRIVRAIELIAARLDGPIIQEEIAEAVFLSPSRFRHLWVEQTGMAFRPYILWMRLQRVVDMYAAGGSLTNAAIEAGFSDLAHMSRTFKRMFGVNPTMLVPEHRNRHVAARAFQPVRSSR